MAGIFGTIFSHCQSQVKRGTSDVPDVRRRLAGLALVDQLPRVVGLLRREFRRPATLHSPRRGVHSGAGSR